MQAASASRQSTAWTIRGILEGNFLERTFAESTILRIADAINGVKKLPGRKSVVLVSEGFSVFGFGWDNAYIREMLQRLVDRSNRAGVVIYAVDPRGLVVTGLTAADSTRGGGARVAAMRSEALRDSQDGLRYVTGETGGFAVVNSNDLSAGFGRIMADQRGYYLIGYQPEAGTLSFKSDRQFRRINDQGQAQGPQGPHPFGLLRPGHGVTKRPQIVQLSVPERDPHRLHAVAAIVASGPTNSSAEWRIRQLVAVLTPVEPVKVSNPLRASGLAVPRVRMRRCAVHYCSSRLGAGARRPAGADCPMPRRPCLALARATAVFVGTTGPMVARWDRLNGPDEPPIEGRYVPVTCGARLPRRDHAGGVPHASRRRSHHPAAGPAVPRSTAGTTTPPTSSWSLATGEGCAADRGGRRRSLAWLNHTRVERHRRRSALSGTLTYKDRIDRTRRATARRLTAVRRCGISGEWRRAERTAHGLSGPVLFLRTCRAGEYAGRARAARHHRRSGTTRTTA